jgi:hypothetical protein
MYFDNRVDAVIGVPSLLLELAARWPSGLLREETFLETSGPRKRHGYKAAGIQHLWIPLV